MWGETLILSVIHKQRKVIGLLPILSVFGCMYGWCVHLRNWLYDVGFLKKTKVDAVVVSIGNIICGGAGKTPTIQLLASFLQDKVATAIVTRGYRSKMGSETTPEKISDGNGPLYCARDCGDESFWLALNTKCPVYVGKDKTISAHKATLDGAKVILIDDGMQHRKLHRDFEIVLIDALDPFGLGAFIPRGLLRDSPKRLQKADLMLAFNVKDEVHFNQLKKQLGFFSKAPVIRVEKSFSCSLDKRYKRVGLFCAIAKPMRFVDAALSLGLDVVDKLILADHNTAADLQLKNFIKQCKDKGAEAIVCTEKDFVKLTPDMSLELPLVAIRMNIQITENKDIWDETVENIIRKGKAFSLD